MLTRNKGKGKSTTSELRINTTSKISRTNSEKKMKQEEITSIIKDNNLDEEAVESPLDPLTKESFSPEEDVKSNTSSKSLERISDDETTPKKEDELLSKQLIMKNEEENHEKFTCNDAILKGILEFVSDFGILPTPTKRNQPKKKEGHVTCNSKIANIVDSLWNEVNINAELDEKDDLLASSNLVRPGIFDILRKRRQIENKLTCRSVAGRLRPYPRPKKYSNMVDDEVNNKTMEMKTRRGNMNPYSKMASKKLRPNNQTFENDLSDNQDANCFSENSSDTNNNDKEAGKRRSKRRIDMKQHIEWKFCYENKNDEPITDKKTGKSRMNKIGKENYINSADEEYPSPNRFNIGHKSPPPMRVAANSRKGNLATPNRRRMNTFTHRFVLTDDQENYETEQSHHNEKIQKVWGFKYSKAYDQYTSSDSDGETNIKTKKPNRDGLNNSNKARRDKLSGLSMFEKLILGLKCSVYIGNKEACIKELDMRDYQTISKRIEKTNFILKSVSIGSNHGNENLYNIIITHAKIKPCMSYKKEANTHADARSQPTKSKFRSISKNAFAKCDFKCKSEDEYKPKSSFYRTMELDKLHEKTYSDSAIYEKNQRKVRAFTSKITRRINLERHRKLVIRAPIKKRVQNSVHYQPRDNSPDTDPELGYGGFHQSLYDKKRKNSDNKRPGLNKIARLSPSHQQEPIETTMNLNLLDQQQKAGNFQNSETNSLAGSVNGLNPASMAPFRRHSPKKLIRKVYTGTSTVPKILNRKRPAPMSSNKQRESLSSMNQASKDPLQDANTVASEVNSHTSNNYQSEANTNHSNYSNNPGENDISDSVSDASSYSQPLIKSINVTEKNSVNSTNYYSNTNPSIPTNSSTVVNKSIVSVTTATSGTVEHRPNTPKPMSQLVNHHNDLVYESSSPSSQTIQCDVNHDLNPATSLSASQLLKMKRVQPCSPSIPMDVTSSSQLTPSNASPVTQSMAGSNLVHNSTSKSSPQTSLFNNANNPRSALSRSNGSHDNTDNGYYECGSNGNKFSSQEEMSVDQEISQSTNSRTSVGYNQTKVILSNPSNSVFIKTFNNGNNQGPQKYPGTKPFESLPRPVLTSSKSASNLNQFDNHQSLTANNYMSESMSASQANNQRNLVHKVHSFRKILPKAMSEVNTFNKVHMANLHMDPINNDIYSPTSNASASSVANNSPSTNHQAKVLKSLLESNQPQKTLTTNPSNILKINNQSGLSNGGIIGKIGPNGQIINQHNQNSQLNAHQSRGTWQFTQRAHVLSATRTKVNHPASVQGKPSDAGPYQTNMDVTESSTNQFDLHQTSNGKKSANIVSVSNPIKVVRLMPESRSSVGQIQRLVSD